MRIAEYEETSVVLSPISPATLRSEVAQSQGNSACSNSGSGQGTTQVTTTDDLAYPHNQTPWGVCSHPGFEYDLSVIPSTK